MIMNTLKNNRVIDQLVRNNKQPLALLMAVFVLCLTLSSCGSNQPKKNNALVAKRLRLHASDNAIDYIRQQEAKLTDIPLAIALEPIADYCKPQPESPEAIMLGYESTMLSFEDLVAFYDGVMIQNEWWPASRVEGHECVLHFEKPNRVCIVSIRSNSQTHKAELVISVSKKESYE